MTDVIDVCDELASIFEPDDTLRDDARARPPHFDPDTLYLWPRLVDYELVSMGYQDSEQFRILVAWAADRMGEGEPDREVTRVIVARARAMRDALAARAGQGTTFDQAHVDQVDFDALTGFDARGFVASVRGYTIIGS